MGIIIIIIIIIMIIIIKTVSYQWLCTLPHFETEVWAIRKFP